MTDIICKLICSTLMLVILISPWSLVMFVFLSVMHICMHLTCMLCIAIMPCHVVVINYEFLKQSWFFISSLPFKDFPSAWNSKFDKYFIWVLAGCCAPCVFQGLFGTDEGIVNFDFEMLLTDLPNCLQFKLLGKGHQKHNPAGHTGDNNTAVNDDSDNLSHGSMASDLPHDMDQKEKFKMIIGKSKKFGQDPIPKDQAQNTISMDAAATAAILQAATRGIKNPNLEVLTKASSGSGQGLGSDGGYLSSSGTGSLYSFRPQGFVGNQNLNVKASASAPVAKAIAEKVAIAAAGEADSSEAHMTKEQKLKAERLKRAKMFAAMLIVF